MKTIALLALLTSIGAAAAPLAVATSEDGATITLTDEAGHCTGDAKLAVWISPDAKSRVSGCWKVAGQGVVVVAFTDGDSARIPIPALRQPTSL